MINHLESGKRNPTVIVAHALAIAMGAKLEEIILSLKPPARQLRKPPADG
jgi:hypothetical protein